MKRLAVVTSTRADFGILQPLIWQLCKEDSFCTQILVTGAHLVEEQGHTVDEIRRCGFQPECCIPIQTPGDMPNAMSCTMAKALERFSAYFDDNRPDLLVVLGDRYEIEAICCAAVNARIPIAHIHGGETTEGAVDECYRHAITKMSYLHFASCEPYRKRIIQLGEAPDRVFNVGALGIDNLIHEKGSTLEELREYCGLLDQGTPFCLVTYHPVTLDATEIDAQMAILTQALERFPHMQFVITKANLDAGGDRINMLWEQALEKHPHWRLVASLGMRRYVTALRNARCMIGNSSSGISEAPAVGLPVINIGERQRGRLQPKGIINCALETDAIQNAICMALLMENRDGRTPIGYLFGDGHAAERIVAILRKTLVQDGIHLKKKFYNINF